MADVSARVRAARTIDVDLTTAAVARGLRDAGVRAVLLKGPALAALLYGPSEHRSYADVDLLLAPGDEAPAGAALRGLGFQPIVDDEALRGHRRVHAHEWSRGRGASVDLHRTLPGAAFPPSVVWDALASETGAITVGGVEVETLSTTGLLVQVALHAAHHGPLSRRAIDDLERAVRRMPLETWSGAAELAARIGATPAFGAGLRLAPAGAELAEELGLPDEVPVDVALRAAGAPPLAVGLDWLLRTEGLGARLALVARTAVPAPSALRLWRPLARRGPGGLAAAYVSHPLWLARHAVPSIRAVRRARRSTR